MTTEIVFLKFIDVQNCFLHLSKDNYDKLAGNSVCGLKLVTSEGKDLYFSSNPVPYYGLTSECMGISNKYANALELKDNEEIIVTPIYNIGSTQSVNVTPISDDDFEILNSSPSEVERSLLNQLRIVWPRQIFPVWISRNVTVNLIVDSISPNLKYGRLEEYTEVVVCDVVMKKNIEKLCSSGSHESPISPLNNLKEKLQESKILKFRCVPSDESPRQDNIFITHPYVVFVSQDSVSEWVKISISSNKKTVWNLKKDGGDMSCVVSLLVFDPNEWQKTDYHYFVSLFVSNTVKNHLGLELGSKVSLDLVHSKTVDITGILISPNFHTEQEEMVISNVRGAFTKAVNQYGDLLLNTKTIFPLKQGNIVVTLRPLQVEWSFIDSCKIRELTIDLNQYNSKSEQDSNFSSAVNNEYEPGNNIINFEKLFYKGKLAIELSLALNSSKKNCFYDNVIYVGKTGCGKTSLVKFLLHKMKGPPFYIYSKEINCCILKGKRVEILSKYMTDILQSCIDHEPSILFLDDLDLLSVSCEDVSEQAFHLIRLTNKLVELIEAYQAKQFFSVVATAKSLDNINLKLMSKKGKSLFTSVIAIPDLSKEDRFELVKNMVIDIAGHQLNNNFNLREIISLCEGYTPLDLKKLTEKAVFGAWQKKAQIGGDFILTYEDFKVALEYSKPTSLQNINLHKGVKKCWLNVGGLKDVKIKLMEVICWTTMYPEIMKQCPVKPQTGILLYGAPGTGKTLIATALAGESKMNFISIKGPELMSKYIGESEEGVRKLFEKAQAASPCLLFFDEFDSLAPRRGQDQTGVTDRVVNQLLTALDGVDSLSGVWVVAATSRPDLIDPAILRPGRIGISVLCPLPDKDARLGILKVLCETVSLSNDVSLEEIASLTDGFTGADLRGVLTSAQIKTLDLLEDNGSLFYEENLNEKDIKHLDLTKDCLMMVLKDAQPSLTTKDKMIYQRIYEKFEKRIPMDLSQQKVTHA